MPPTDTTAASRRLALVANTSHLELHGAHPLIAGLQRFPHRRRPPLIRDSAGAADDLVAELWLSHETSVKRAELTGSLNATWRRAGQLPVVNGQPIEPIRRTCLLIGPVEQSLDARHVADPESILGCLVSQARLLR